MSDLRTALREGRAGVLNVEWFPFGYEYEVLFPNLRRLFGYDDRIVFESEEQGRVLVIEDFGRCADFNDADIEERMHEQVLIADFEDAAARDEYLRRAYTNERPWLLDRIAEARGRRP